MENILQVLNQVRSLVLAGHLSEAIEALLLHESELPVWAVADLENLQRRWNALQQQWESGEIGSKEKSREDTRIARTILIALDVLGGKTYYYDEKRRSLWDAPSSGAEPPEEDLTPPKEEPVTPGKGIEMAEPPAPIPAAIQNLKPDTPGDTVICSAFAPPQAKPGEDILVQVWAHLPENRQEAMTYATEFDPGTSMRQFRTLSAPFEKGDEIAFVLTAKGFEIGQNTQNLIWTGQTESVQFVVSVPVDFTGNKLFFTLTAYKNTIPVGQLLFTVGASQTPEREPAALGDEARRFRKAFVSYSSKDRPEVLRRVQMLGMFDVDYFMDLLSLEPGERWEKGLYKNIDTCDVFLLFWSSNAKASKWVLQELEYALARKHGDENTPPLIQPVPIEGPPIVSPPPELGHMHFNDKILYFLAAGSGRV